MLCRSYDDQKADNFLEQRISMALQVRNVARVLGTGAAEMRSKKFVAYSYFLNLYILAAFVKSCFYQYTGRLAGIGSLLVVFSGFWSTKIVTCMSSLMFVFL